jgi:tetrahydromethanopterin S-methyltransferase subunit D
MFHTAGASAGAGTALAVAASRSSGKPRLLWSAGAVVALLYAVWTIVVGSLMTQFALGVEKASRSPDPLSAVP